MKKRNAFFGISLIVVAITLVALGSVIMRDERMTRFGRNVQIDNVSVGGMTKENASQIVAKNLHKKTDNTTIKINYKDKNWELKDFDVDNGVKNVVNNVFNTTKINNADTIKFIANKTGNFKTAISDVYVNFDEKIDEIVAEIEVEPTNASVIFNPNSKNMFQIEKEQYGIKVDREKLIDDIEQQFLTNQDIVVEVSVSLVEPEITENYFDDKLNLQSKFSTSIKDSQAGRRNNVNVALQKISGTVILPDESISFNKITSPQDASGGYQDAIIIKNGKFVNGMGGGICQASTTFYNACLRANLEIEEVHKHTLPVHYVDPALDAMVSEYADLVVKNTSKYPVYIKGYVSGDDAIVEIYGKSLPDGVTIKCTSEITKKIPHKGDKIVVDTDGEYQNKVLYKGEFYRLKYPKDGYEATSFIEYYKNGELIKKEQLRTEKYDQEQGILIEGAKDLPEGFVLPEQTEKFIQPEEM